MTETAKRDPERKSVEARVKDPMDILLVDDDRLFLRWAEDLLKGGGFSVRTAGDGREALALLDGFTPHVMITDLVMPQMDGFEFIRAVRDRFPLVPVIVVSGRDDFESARSLIKFWVYDYLIKPVREEDLLWCVRGAAEKVKAARREEEYIKTLELEIQAQMERNRYLYYEAVQSLVNAIEAKDPYTQGHSLRVTRLSATLALAADIQGDSLDGVSLAGQLHDIGKLAISDAILNKDSTLTEEEYDLVKRHPEASHRILAPILDPTALKAVLHHHERWDGRGYPAGLAGLQIPVAARIISLADSFDAMTSKRAYRRTLSTGEALEEIHRCAGTQFDPGLAALFIDTMEKETGNA